MIVHTINLITHNHLSEDDKNVIQNKKEMNIDNNCHLFVLIILWKISCFRFVVQFTLFFLDLAE